MKIAYLISEYPKISHAYIRREIRALEKLGFDIQRFSIRPSRHTLVDEADIRELAITTCILQAGFLSLVLHLIRSMILMPIGFLRASRYAAQLAVRAGPKAPHHIAYLVEACYLSRMLRLRGIDHIHVHFGSNSAAVALLCHHLSNISYSVTVHGPYDFDYAATLSLDLKAKYATFVGVVSYYGQAQMMRWCHMEDWEKLHLIRCGVDEAFSDSDLQPLPTQPVLLNIGRLHMNKGQLILLSATNLLRQRGIYAKMNIVGDGPLHAQLEKRIIELDLSEQVSLVGSLSEEEVREALVNATALISASLAENLPVVIVEAFAMGRPVVATHIAGIPELVKDANNGILVQPGSAAKLADGIEEMLSLPIEVRAAMGKRGRDLVVTQHNILLEADKLARLFRKTCVC